MDLGEDGMDEQINTNERMDGMWPKGPRMVSQQIIDQSKTLSD